MPSAFVRFLTQWLDQNVRDGPILTVRSAEASAFTTELLRDARNAGLEFDPAVRNWVTGLVVEARNQSRAIMDSASAGDRERIGNANREALSTPRHSKSDP